MAKSKNGGSRAFIRGRIGSDVYSVGKNGQGARQQVVRSLAVQVSNPRTQSQMVGRMLMSTVMQAVSAMSPIIDHSFDGVAKGQPSISKFIKENYARVKNYYENIADGAEGSFNLNKYQEKGILGGSWLVSDGNVAPLVQSANIFSGMYGGAFKISIPKNTPDTDLTFAWLKQQFPAGVDGYVTVFSIIEIEQDKPEFFFQRVSLNLAKADTDQITSQNYKEFFVVEGNTPWDGYMETADASTPGFMLLGIHTDPDNSLAVSYGQNMGSIVSKKIEGGWQHSRWEFVTGNADFPYYRSKDVALATYPTGTAQFLNGGDL